MLPDILNYIMLLLWLLSVISCAFVVTIMNHDEVCTVVEIGEVELCLFFCTQHLKKISHFCDLTNLRRLKL